MRRVRSRPWVEAAGEAAPEVGEAASSQAQVAEGEAASEAWVAVVEALALQRVEAEAQAAAERWAGQAVREGGLSQAQARERVRLVASAFHASVSERAVDAAQRAAQTAVRVGGSVRASVVVAIRRVAREALVSADWDLVAKVAGWDVRGEIPAQLLRGYAQSPDAVTPETPEARPGPVDPTG